MTEPTRDTSTPEVNRRPKTVRRLIPALAVVVAMLGLFGSVAVAETLQEKKAAKEAELAAAKKKKKVLTGEIAKFTERIDELIAEVAELRSKEAVVTKELEQTIAELKAEKERLAKLRKRYDAALETLAARMVAIYEEDEPDLITVVLNSDGFTDLAERYEYLRAIQEQDEAIAVRVHELRDASQASVKNIREKRDIIEKKKKELEEARAELEAREAELEAVRSEKQGALGKVEENIKDLHGDLSDLQAQIEAQIRASQQPAGEQMPGPLPGPSASGFIWPLSGTLTSPFGPRWGRMHEGIDISVPVGTPIRAVADGRTIIAAYTGGYGNYTCIDHGGHLSSCYAHQNGYNTSVGQMVKQGQVIGSSGNTGNSTGPHLHFEVRVNGAAVNPLSYL